jgi:hypothetical protein
MKQVKYTDLIGRVFLVELPDNAPEEHAEMGAIVGPPDLSGLGLPLEMEVRLNNSLYARGLFTSRDIRRKRGELLAVWQSVLQTDVVKLANLYEGVPSGRLS